MENKDTDDSHKQRLYPINELFESRLPVLIWVSLVFSATMLLQNFINHLLLNSFLFTVVIAAHGLLHWHSYRITRMVSWLYFVLQGILIYLCSIIMPDGSPAVLFGLLPVLIAQSMGVTYNIKKIILVAILSTLMFVDSIITLGEVDKLLLLFPLFIMMIVVVLAYAFLFLQQVQARLRTQHFLRDLEVAHKKVEDLTLANERQRMARDLHDTLAQGVAGLIMQLEAADAYMAKGNTERTQSIIKQSMKQARRTLAEARRAIDDLRAKSAPVLDFREAVADEVRHFTDSTGMQVDMQLNLTRPCSKLVVEHCLHVVKECLTNIARHAKAEKGWVNLSGQDGRFILQIRDDGIGFNPDTIGRKAGHYGLLGIKERVRLLGGKLEVFSSSTGTLIQIEAPTDEGELT